MSRVTSQVSNKTNKPRSESQAAIAWLRRRGADWVLKLTQGQVALLEHLLKNHRGFSLQLIATKLGVTRQHVESSTRNLESRGLVELHKVGTGDKAFVASPGPLLLAVRDLDPAKIVQRGRSRQSV